MTDFDPFAPAADEAQAEAPAPAPEKPKKAPSRPAKTPESDGKVVVTLKGGAGFDDPWIVIHADSVEDANAQLNADLVTLMDRTQSAAALFRGKAPAKPASSNAAQRPARQDPPDGAPEKPGDDWVYRTGVTKSGPNAGKTWQAWMPPQGSDDKPVFFK